MITDGIGDVMEIIFNPLLEFLGLAKCFPIYDPVDTSRWFRKDEGCWLWIIGETIDVLKTIITELILCFDNDFERESGCRIWWLWDIATAIVKQFLCCAGAVDISDPEYLNGFRPPTPLPFVGSKCPDIDSEEWRENPSLPNAGRCVVAPLGRFVYDTALSVIDCYKITEVNASSIFTCRLGWGFTVGGLLLTLAISALLFIVGIFVARLLTLAAAGKGCFSLCTSCCYSPSTKGPEDSEPCCGVSSKRLVFVGDIVSFRRKRKGGRPPKLYMVAQKQGKFLTLLQTDRKTIRGVKYWDIRVESRFEPHLWRDAGGAAGFVNYVKARDKVPKEIALPSRYIEDAKPFLQEDQKIRASNDPE